MNAGFAGLVRGTAAPAWRLAHLLLAACVLGFFVTDLFEALPLLGALPDVGLGTLLDVAWLPPLVLAVAAGRVATEAEPEPPTTARPLTGWPWWACTSGWEPPDTPIH